MQDQLNNRPRKRLGNKTPVEVTRAFRRVALRASMKGDKDMKLIHAQIAECQNKLDIAKKELRDIVIDLDADDETLIHLRKRVRSLLKELLELDFQILRN